MTRPVSFRAWRARDLAGLAGGTHLGTEVGAGGLRMVEPVGTRRYTDPHTDLGSSSVPRCYARDYAWAVWVSPEVHPGHGFDALVPSWNARTPGGSWLELEARTSIDGLTWSRWYSLGRWADSAREIRPTSLPGQDDDDATVRTEVLAARPGVSWSAYQLRLLLHRPRGLPTDGDGSTCAPEVSLVAAVVSAEAANGPGAAPDAPGPRGGVAHGLELPVPAYSQQLHRGSYPQWGSGGESWCSPTSTAMVLGTWGLGPAEEEYAWVDAGHADRFVPHAAGHVFDHAYGAGNWSFNTAYAARYGTEAFVTRLRSLAEAELFVAAGIPLVVSVSFTRDELDGAGYDTAGHLLTVIGFDAAGDVICNDPASHELPSNDEVRVVYDRDQLEQVWQRAAGGIVYVIRPPHIDLPAPVHGPAAASANW